MPKYNDTITSGAIEELLTYTLIFPYADGSTDRFMSHTFEVLPASDGSYMVTVYKNRQVLKIKTSDDSIDKAALFIKPNGSVADDSNMKAFGKEITKILKKQYGFEFTAEPINVAPGYCIQYKIKLELPESKTLQTEPTNQVKKIDIKENKKVTAMTLVQKFIESIYDSPEEDFEFRHHNTDDYDDYDDYDDDEIDLEKADFDDDDIDIEDEAYWADAKEIDPEDYNTASKDGMMNWTNTVTTDPDIAKAFAEEDDESDEINNFKMAYGSRIEQDEADGYYDDDPSDKSAIVEDDNEIVNWDDESEAESEFDSFFESILNESDCGASDGAVTAGDFASEVPENMGAVVQSDKKDQKYSSVFDED